MAVKSKPENANELEWNVDNEVQLFLAMTGHKPVGVNKYFHMLCIKDKFVSSVHKEVRREAIWNHLNTLYDMQALDDFEHLPFPNPEKEFSLPDSEFATLMKEKLDDLVLNKESNSKPESETELRREVKRELQVYKGMKDIKKENKDDTAKEINPEQSMETQSIDPAVENNFAQLGSSVPPLKKTVFQDKKSGREKESKKVVSSPMSKLSASPVSKSISSPSKSTISPVSKSANNLSRNLLEKDSKYSTKSRMSSKKDTVVKESKSNLKKDRVKDLNSVEEPPKRGSTKRSWPTRSSATDSASTKSASPITTPTPPPTKRRRI